MAESVIAALVGVGGVVVGSVIAFLIQWFITKRQRLWTIEDGKIQHQRASEHEMRQERYERLKEKVNVISSQVGRKTTALIDIESYQLGEHTLTEEKRKEVYGRIDAQEGEVQSALMAIGSEGLFDLHQTLNLHFYSARSELDLKEFDKAWQAAQAVHRKMEELLDEALLK